MRDALTRRVDPWQAARAGRVLSGTLGADRLPRLSALAEPVDALDVHLGFEPVERVPSGRDGPGAVRITVRVEGILCAVCQRCLDPVRFPMNLESTVVATSGGDSASSEHPDGVVVEPGEMLDVALLVEDEMLLDLPFAPTHAPGECVARAPVENPAVAGPDEAEPSDRKDNPFAVLGALRRSGRDND